MNEEGSNLQKQVNPSAMLCRRSKTRVFKPYMTKNEAMTAADVETGNA